MDDKIPSTDPTTNGSYQTKLDPTGLTCLGLNIFLSVAGQMILKLGLDQTTPFDKTLPLLSNCINMVNLYVIVGLAAYIIGTVFWLLTLFKLDLSFAYPASSLQYLLVFIGAWYFLGETLNWFRIAGLAFICSGVVVMSMDRGGS